MPDGYSQIFRSYVFGPLGFWTKAPLRWAAKFDPFLFLDCAPTPSTWRNSRKGSNFAIWQHWGGREGGREEEPLSFGAMTRAREGAAEQHCETPKSVGGPTTVSLRTM